MGDGGVGEWAAAGPWSHAWPVKLTLLHPAHTSFCLQYLQFLCMRLGFWISFTHFSVMNVSVREFVWHPFGQFLSVPLLTLTLFFRHTYLSVFKIHLFTLINTFSPLLFSFSSVQITLHIHIFRAFAHISPSCRMEVAVVQTTPGGRSSAVDSLGPGRLWYSGLYGANRWSLVETHSLWASCPTKRLSVIVLNLCCFNAALGSTAVVKRPKATLPSPERNKQTKP